MITPEEFASIEVGDTVTVRREITGTVERCEGGYLTIDRDGDRFTPGPWWDLVSVTKPTSDVRVLVGEDEEL